MRKRVFYILLTFISLSTEAQELILNGGFESSSGQWTSWSTTTAGTNLWAGIGSCTAGAGTNYMWFGDQNEATGIDNATENMYQTVTIPGNADSCKLTLMASINTMETGTTDYDFLDINIYNTTGTLLYSLGYLGNTNGVNGIPGCQTWSSYFVNIPSQYFGQTVRIYFEFSTDNIYSTIFRLDQISLMAYATTCTYNLSQSSYTCPDNSANTYNSVATLNTQTSCTWSAAVATGGSWLTCSSSGTGNGSFNISVTQNTGMTSRTGTITAGGQTLTVIQPGISCTYNLSQPSYTCPDNSSNTYNAVSTMITPTGCVWNAAVTSGGSWLTCSSSGTGNGNINITVSLNSSIYSRSGTIIAGGQSLTIVQPGLGGCIYTLSQTSYTCPDNSSNTYNAVSTMNAQAGCVWNASVTSGGSWLTCSLTGSGNGDINITVSQNTSVTSRTGTISVAGQTITIIQPGITCTYSLSQSSYTCPDNSSNTYNAIATIITPTGCIWNAAVTLGGSWLTCSSSGSGNGYINITVSLNTSVSSRTGTISIDGQNLSIIQPGLVCTYLLSQTSYTCPDNHANTYNAVVTMIAQTGCAWNSVVTSGGSWLTCTSSGSGNGNINITVSLNTSINPRTGTISVQGQTLTIIQPGANCTYSFSLSSYSCPNSNANTYSNIALVNTQAGCLWNASVSSGNSWLTTSSTGTGSGSLSIIVLENTGTSPRTGTISVETQILTIIQPAYGSGIEEVNSDFINIFPNPTYESININTNPLLLNHRFEIIDVNGKILYSGKIINPSMTVSLSVFPSGVYVLRIPDFNMMYKLIKL